MGSPSRVWLLLPFLFSALALWAGRSFLPGASPLSHSAGRALFPRTVWAANTSAPNEEWVEMEIRDVIPLPEVKSHAVVLVSPNQVLLPVFVSEEVALSVALRLARQTPPEPLATDLLASLLDKLGGKLVSVQIDSLTGDEYRGQVTVVRSGEKIQVPARPSDALALALDSGAHVYARPAVLKEAGITPEQIEELRKKLPKEKPPAPPKEPGTPAPPTNISL